ncbi:hypothetical protein NDN08_002168 [Rhodosorus marinus]|uniref:Uncharacterized protein n=1 Tax=Rhodosorus marinus TaxID=101924 RepID=A0AAV8UX97_9RHOD|nr:hypothetical protein NDN08_002168 [Rhodosorus marinus]
MDAVSKFAVTNQVTSSIGGGQESGTNGGSSIGRISMSDVISSAGGQTNTRIYEKNFPPLLKMWYVENSHLSESAQDVLVRTVRLFWLINVASVFNFIIWLVLTIANNDWAWIWLLLSIFLGLLYFLTASITVERVFFGLWQTDFKAMKTATYLHAFLILNIFLNLLLGWGSFNGWLRYLTVRDPLLVFWQVITAFNAFFWTGLLFLNVDAAYRLRKWEKCGPPSLSSSV